MKTERGSTTSQPVEKLLKKKLWPCRKTEQDMNETELFIQQTFCYAMARRSEFGTDYSALAV
jgi:hypothetical protein